MTIPGIKIKSGADDGEVRIAASILLYSTVIPPSLITEKLNLLPSRVAEMGIKIGKRTGKASRIPKHLWLLSSEGNVNEPDVSKHLKWLSDRILGVENEFHALCATGSIDAKVKVVVWTCGDAANFQIPAALLSRLERLGLDLEFDFADYGEEGEKGAE